MRGFRSERGFFVAELDSGERAALAAVVADVAELLGAGRVEDGGRDATVRADGAVRGTTPSPESLADLSLRVADIDPPGDTAVRRLLPDASRDDPEISAEFRRLTEDDLRRVKTARLAALWDTLTAGPEQGWSAGVLLVRPDAAAALAATLTDVRLVLADRLGLDDDEASEALYDALQHDESDDASVHADPRAQVNRTLGSIYAALSWLQESLLAVLLDELDRPS